MWRAARSMAPRATKYDRASSTLVSVRPVSARTLFATAKPTADSAAVSQSTIRRADPALLWRICISSSRDEVHVQRHSYGTDVQFGWVSGLERRHFDAHGKRKKLRPHPVRPPHLERGGALWFQICKTAERKPVRQHEGSRTGHNGSEADDLRPRRVLVDAENLHASLFRACIRRFIDDQPHALIAFAGDDLHRRNARASPPRFIERMRRYEAHALCVGLQKRTRGRFGRVGMVQGHCED